MNAIINQGVAIGKALGARDGFREHGSRRIGLITPGETRWAKWLAGRLCVIPIRVNRRGDLVNRRIIPSQAVVENHNIACAGQSRCNPFCIVLLVKSLTVPRPCIICGGVAPAIKQVTAFATLSTTVTGGFRRGCAVVNHPGLAIPAHTEQDLVEGRVVIN